MRNIRVIVGLYILLAVSHACVAEDSPQRASAKGGKPPDHAAVPNVEVQVRRAMEEFLRRAGSHFLPQGTHDFGRPATGQVKPGPYTAVDGQTYYFSAPSFVARIRAEDLVVVSFRVKGSQGNQRTALPGAKGTREPRIGRERARSLAEGLLRTLLGPEDFKQYREFGEGFCSEGQEAFFFAKSDFDATVRRGIAWFNVCVDAVAGEVASFTRRLQIPDEDPRISAERAREIVERHLQAQPPTLGTRAAVKSLTLLPVYYRKRGRVTVWAVRYWQGVKNFLEWTGDVFVDATTGEILPDPSLPPREEVEAESPAEE